MQLNTKASATSLTTLYKEGAEQFIYDPTLQ